MFLCVNLEQVTPRPYQLDVGTGVRQPTVKKPLLRPNRSNTLVRSTHVGTQRSNHKEGPEPVDRVV